MRPICTAAYAGHFFFLVSPPPLSILFTTPRQTLLRCPRSMVSENNKRHHILKGNAMQCNANSSKKERNENENCDICRLEVPPALSQPTQLHRYPRHQLAKGAVGRPVQAVPWMSDESKLVSYLFEALMECILWLSVARGGVCASGVKSRGLFLAFFPVLFFFFIALLASAFFRRFA